jgi:hypothetical protein
MAVWQVAGAGDATFNGLYTEQGTHNGYPYYTNASGRYLYYSMMFGKYVLADMLDAFMLYYYSNGGALPASPWSTGEMGTAPAPEVTEPQDPPDGDPGSVVVVDHSQGVVLGGDGDVVIGRNYAVFNMQGSSNFALTEATEITGGDFKLKVVATPYAQVRVRLETDNSGSPSGTLAHKNADAVIDVTSITERLVVDFPIFTLPTGTYHFRLSCPNTNGTGGGLNYFVEKRAYAGCTLRQFTNGSTPDGTWTNQTIDFRLFAPNSLEPPTCSHVVNSVVGRTVSVTPTASAVDPATITDITITWGDGQVTTGCVSGQAYSHTYNPAGGTFGIFATATDSNDLTDESEITQTVIDPNETPICSFTATVGADNRTVTINANASSDPDGTIASWCFQPDEGAEWIAGTVGQPLEHVYPHGIYTCTVEVTDNEGATATQQAIIDAENVAPTCVLSAVTVGSDNASFLFHLRDSSDVDGTLVSARWRLDEGEWHDASLSENIVGTAPHGTYLLTVEVTDDDGATGTATAVVALTNAAPVASAVLTVDTNRVTLTDGSTDEDGTVVVVSVDWGDESTAEELTPGGAATHEYATVGEYSIQLLATDDDGATDTCEQVVHIESMPIIRPTYYGQSPGADVTWDERTLPEYYDQAPGGTAHWREEQLR